LDQNANVRRAAFLDLNGTLVQPVSPERFTDLMPFPGVFDAVARLTEAGLVCPVITVQSRIAKGLFTLNEFEQWFAVFASELARHGGAVVGPYVCPHRFAEPCQCKKPQATLYHRAAIDHGLNVTASFVVGDSADDMRAARRIGASSCLVRTGWAEQPDLLAAASIDADAVVTSFQQAADWILGQVGPQLEPERAVAVP
jgi:histidinol-phosphate phosphatase family protein